MHYEEVPPPPPLRRVVECLWILQDGPGAGAGGAADAADRSEGDPRGTADLEPVLPDGCPELVLHLGEPFREARRGSPPRRQARSFLVGQLREPLDLEPGARVDVVGVRFRPHAARCLLGAPLHEITGSSVELAAVAPALSRRLEARVPEAGSNRDRFATACHLLAGALDLSLLDSTVEGIVRRMRSSRGALTVADLAEAAGRSSRQLQRGFRRDVGLGPKTLSRIFRFQGVFQRLGAGESPDWASLAPACGYADQAHLVREFGEFAGRPPGSYLRNPPRLAAHFLSGTGRDVPDEPHSPPRLP